MRDSWFREGKMHRNFIRDVYAMRFQTAIGLQTSSYQWNNDCLNSHSSGNQRTNGPANAQLRPSYHFFDLKAYVSKIDLVVK